jgi:hypothetical protein
MSVKNFIILSAAGETSANISANTGPPRPNSIPNAGANTTVAHNFNTRILPTRYMLTSGASGGTFPIANSTSTNGATWTTPANTGIPLINFSQLGTFSSPVKGVATCQTFDRIVMGGGDTAPGASRCIGAISYDEGRTWSSITFPNDNPITILEWGKTGPGNSLFMGSNKESSYIYTSFDGTSWTKVNNSIASASSSRYIASIMWDGMKWLCACKSTAGEGNIYEVGKSYDNGVTWTFNTISSGIYASEPINFAYGNGKYVLALWTGVVFTSTDSDNWTLVGDVIPGVITTSLRYVSAANGGIFMAASSGAHYWSQDASTWTGVTTTGFDANNPWDIVWGGNHWLALSDYPVGGRSNTYTIPSISSSTWTKRFNSATGYYFSNIVKHRNTTIFTGGLSVANALAGNIWCTHADVRNGWQRASTASRIQPFDGVNFHNYRGECFIFPVWRTTGFGNTSIFITPTGFANAQGEYVTIDTSSEGSSTNIETAGLITLVTVLRNSSGGNNGIYINTSNVYSSAAWSIALNTDGQPMYDVKYIPRIRLFIAVGSSRIYTSPDGINWTRRQYNMTDGLRKIEDNGYRIVACINYPGNQTAIWTSIDGIRWKRFTPTNLSSYAESDLAYLTRHSKFIADDGFYSQDGGPTPFSDSGLTSTFDAFSGPISPIVTRSGHAIRGPHNGSGDSSVRLYYNMTTGANGAATDLTSSAYGVTVLQTSGGNYGLGPSGFLP